jgi:23S rRNA (cytosine1962-C5)-methyltransferase
MNAVTVTKRGADRIRRGHLWIYRSDVLEARDAAGGSIARVQDEHRNFIGQAFYSDSSQIVLRFLTTADESIDRDWWCKRIREAAARRNVGPETNAYRLIYSEGDLLPSLIVDR